jgi:FtsZ-binding cell division protein ZapB
VRPGSMLSVFDDEEVRRGVLRYVIAKHQDLYWRRLPELLAAAQRSAAMLDRVLRAREHLRTEIEIAATPNGALPARLEALTIDREMLLAERDSLRTERHRLKGEGDRLRDEYGRLAAERDRLGDEIRAWQERVAFMEGTRAWRLRQRLVDLKRALERRTTSEEG